MKEGIERIKFDLPLEYTRAIRSRAGIEGVYARDVLIAALDAYLSEEIADARKRLAATEVKQAPKVKKKD